MTLLDWTTGKYLTVADHRVPCSEYLGDAGPWQPGVRKDSSRSYALRSLAWYGVKVIDDLFVDGFIEWVAGRWIRETVTDETTFLEIGCGDMSMSRYLPKSVCYNAFDISLSEFHLRKLLRHRPDANVAVASITDIPLPSSVASLVLSTQVLEYVPRIDRALEEIRRVAAPGAFFVCTIANGFCHKYEAKGVHPGHANRWSYRGFVDLMARRGFRMLEGEMRGFWVPLHLHAVKTSFALPIVAHDEALNTHFLFLFRVEK